MGILVRNNKVISAGGKILYTRASDPFELPNLKLFLSASRMTQQIDGSVVSNYVDFSGNSYHATQENVSLQPTFEINELGINAGIKGDGVNDVLALTGDALSIFKNINKYTIQVLAKRSIISTTSTLFQCQNNAGLGVRVTVQFQADGTIYTGIRKDDSTVYNLFSSVVNDTTQHFIQVTLSTANILYLYVDGVLHNSIAVPSGNTVNSDSQKMEVLSNTNISQYGTAIINGISINQSYSDPSIIQAQYRGYLQRGYL